MGAWANYAKSVIDVQLPVGQWTVAPDDPIWAGARETYEKRKAANAQAKYCAVQIVRALRDLPPLTSTLANTCYSLLSPDYAISIAGVYRADSAAWRPVPGSGGTSPMEAGLPFRQREANYARSWFAVVTDEVFG